jgi:hypothetical protein
MDIGSLQGLALGAISLAVKKGWGVQNFGDIYYAYVYLYQTFVNACNGTFPTLVSAPKWLWELLAALRPKSSRFKTGSINYKWLTGSLPGVPPFEIVLGSASAFLGVPSLFKVNGLIELIPPPAAYTTELGERAINSLFQYFPDKGLFKRESDPGENAFLHGDVSVFQSVYPEWGATALGPGGIALSILGEVFDQCPMLSKFTLYQQTFWRGSQELKKNAGTASYIVGRMSDMESIKEIRCKVSPIFKFYNFDQYFLTLTYILGLAMEQMSADNSVKEVPPCPLTSWAAQLLLRQTLLPRFCNEMAQDLTQTGDASEGLFPMICVNNGVSITNEALPSMLLPFVFAENCRSATRLLRDIHSQYGKSTIDIVPILCRPSKASIPTLGNFTYQNAVTGVQPIYLPAPPSEVDVDLLDLSYGNPVKNYLTANGEYMGTLVCAWNDWIKKLGNQLTTLVSVGTEPGIAALNTVINTAHVRRLFLDNPAPAPMPSNPQAKRPAPPELAGKRLSSDRPKEKGFAVSRKKIGAPMPDPTTPSSSIYQFVACNNLTSTMPFLAPLMRYTRAFVHPQGFANIDFNKEQTISFQQSYQVEPNKLPYDDLAPLVFDTANESITMDTIALASAALDIKSNLSTPSEAEIELSEMAKKGDGGFFTSLAGIIGDALGLPGVRKVANMVGTVVDI